MMPFYQTIGLRAMGLALILGGVAMAEEAQPVSRQALKRESERLHGEIAKLRRKVEKLSGQKGVERPEAVAGMSDSGRATEGDVERALNPVKQDLADLALAINRLAPKEPPSRPGKSHRKRVSESGAVYRVRLKGEVQNRTVTIRNRGEDVVVNPRVVMNGKRDWFSTPSILEEALEPGMSKREKAVAIWKFLKDNRYHYTPAHDHIEVHDPVRFLNVYGYGFCDDSATNFMVLAEQAGLKARVWGLTGHVVPEAHFEGSWHMLDPDGEIYYLDDDGETISSVATLEQRPDIIRKYPSPYYTDAEKLVEIYTTTEDNRVAPFYKERSEARHTMGYVLRPGESLMRSRDNWGIYFSSRYLDEPRVYGNGRLTFEPIFENELFRKGAESVRGVQIEQADTGWALVPSRAGRQGALIYRFTSPYPFLDGTVNVVGELEGKGRMALAFSETGEDWQPVWSTDVSGRVKTEIPIGGYFRNGYGEPVYTYSLKVTLSAPKGGTAQVQHLRFASDVQVAPHSLPALETGENEVRYVDESSDNRDVEVLFGYDSVDH